MTTNILNELQKDHLRERFNKYTRKAFQMLPGLDNPDNFDSDNPEALAVLDKEQQEVDMFKRDPKRYGSVFFVMQKS